MKWWRSKLFRSSLAAGTLFFLAKSLFLDKYFFEVKRFKIGNQNSSKQVRMLLLTDLHFEKRLAPFYRRLARTINAIHPDLILVCGDTIDEDGQPAPARMFFSLINQSIPKIAIRGNHDHKNDVSLGALKKIYEQNNGTVLVNETKELTLHNTLLTITGVDDFIEGEGRFADAVRTIGFREHHFLLIHSPLQQEQVLDELRQINQGRDAATQLNIQYIFAGHNHGGQVRLGPIVPVLPERSGNYINGWYNQTKPFLYVSRGFGTSQLPFRFGARSEVTVFDYGV